MIRITRVRPIRPSTLDLEFSDGASGPIDLGKLIPFDGVFAPLQDPDYFSQVRLDPETGTVVWPNGADLDAVSLHSEVIGKPLPRPS